MSADSPAIPYHVGNTSVESLDHVSMTFSISNRCGLLKEGLEVFANLKVDLKQIESRPSVGGGGYDFYVEFDSDVANEDKLEAIRKCLEAIDGINAVKIMGRRLIASSPWYPQKIADLDLFTQKVLAYGAELNSDHPGFKDPEYRKRRMYICSVAENYKHGQEIPRIDYLPSELETWGVVYDRLTKLYPSHACKQHTYIFPLLEENCGYSRDNIPQLQDISTFLKECTGWSLRPVSGLLSPRDFLNGLAYRVFHSTQYIRHHSKPLYTPEPDVCHELLGHVPLFADPEFADFSQEIGLASLGASDEDIEKLATCYWFTVEFGLCKQVAADGTEEVKAFGAGLLSSFGELEYSISDAPKKIPFDPAVAAATPYPITEYQPTYFVADSFERAKTQLRTFASGLSRGYELYYNPVTQCVIRLDTPEKAARVAKSLSSQLALVSDALGRM